MKVLGKSRRWLVVDADAGLDECPIAQHVERYVDLAREREIVRVLATVIRHDIAYLRGAVGIILLRQL